MSNIPPTHASSVTFVGPTIGESPLWKVDTKLAFGGPGTRPVVFKRMGLTTLFERPTPHPVAVWPAGEHKTASMRPPSLLQAHPAASEGTLHMLRDGAGATLEGKLLVADGQQPASVVVAMAVDRWPDQDVEWVGLQKVNVMVLPPLHVVEGRLAALLAADGSALPKFLGLDPHNQEVLGGVKIEMVKVGGQDAWPIELTPAGIEFKAWLPDPSYDFAPSGSGLLEAWVCLESPTPGSFRLRLLAAAAEPDMSAVQQRLGSAFGRLAAGGAPASLRFDARAAAPELTWPLAVQGAGAKLVGKYARGQVPPWTDWSVDFGKDAFDLRIATAPTSVLALTVRSVRMQREAVGPRLTLQFNDAPNNTGALKPFGPEAGALFTATSHGWSAAAQFNGGAAADVSIDLDEPCSRLARVYVEGHALASGDPVPHVFLAMRDGWLQAPVPGEAAGAGAGAPERPPWCAPMSGRLAVDAEHGALVVLEAAAHATATIEWQLKARVMEPQQVRVHSWGTEGRLRGYLFAAESSPGAEEAVPSLVGGPAATRDLPLDFGAPRDTGRFWKAKFAVSSTGWNVQISLAAGDLPCVGWVRHPSRPLVSVMPVTRSARNAMRPSTSRDLLPVLLDAPGSAHPVELFAGSGERLPQLQFAGTTRWPELTAAGGMPQVGGTAIVWTMMMPSLQGVEFVPTLKQAAPTPVSLGACEWRGQLRYGLPMLDELFASTELPRRGGTAAASSEQLVATTLRFADMQQVWVRNTDRLRLTWAQDRAATGWIACDARPAPTDVEGLVAPYKWSAPFAISLAQPVTLPNFASAVPFGSYALGGCEYALDAALPGLGDTGQPVTFAIASGKLQAGAGPIRITGLAAAGFASGDFDMDSRGFGLARTALRADAMSVRRARRDDASQAAEFALLTLLQPLPVPATPLSLALALFVRDLAVTVQQAGPVTTYRFDGSTNPLEGQLGATGQALEREGFGQGLHEWRLFETGDDASRRYDIGWGPLAFTPLRLWKLEVRRGPAGRQLQALHVLGRMSLATFSGPWTGGGEGAPAPFAPEEPYASGELFLLKVEGGKVDMVAVKVTHAAGLLKVEEQPAGLATIALHAQVRDANGAGRSLPVRLQLEPRPGGSATLQARLFGSDRTIMGTVDHFDLTELKVGFTPPAAAVAGEVARARRMDLQVTASTGSQRKWLATLDIELEVALRNAHGDVLFAREAGGACRWLNVAHVQELRYELDHRAGRLIAEFARAPSELPLEPLSGFFVERFAVRGVLSMSLAGGTGWPQFDAAATPVHLEMEGDGELPRALRPGAPPAEQPAKRMSLRHLYSGPSPRDGASPPLVPAVHAISIDWQAEYTSVIRWPVDIRVRADDVSVDDGAMRAWSRLVDVQGAGALSHRASMQLRQHGLPADCIGRVGAAVGIARPWNLLATVDHEVGTSDRSIRWRSLDRLVILPASGVWDIHAAALQASVYAFAARYTHGPYRTQSADWTQVPHAGVALLPWAQTGFADPHLASALQKLAGRPEPVVAGAAATLFPVGDGASPTGNVAVVPWLAAIGGHQALAELQLDQGGPSLRTWRFALVDALAASLELRSQRRPRAAGLSSGDEEARIHEALAAATGHGGFGAKAASQLPVSQAWFEPFDQRTGKPQPLDPATSITDVPYFPQAMLVMSALWHRGESSPLATTLLVSGDASQPMLRVTVAPATPAVMPLEPASMGGELAVQPVDLVAMDTRRVSILPRALSLPAPSDENVLWARDDVRSRAHIRELVERRIPHPVAIVARARTRAGATSWLQIAPSRQPEDSGTITTVVDNSMLPPSPALGWPSAAQLAVAAKMVAVLGPEEPLVSAEAGLAGRGHAVRLPAWAPSATTGPEALYVSVVSHVAFLRAKQVGYRGPAARHLAVAPTRVRAPLTSATAAVLRRLVGGEESGGTPVLGELPVAPISPPRLERSSVGHRPGEMHLWGMSMVVPGESEAFDASRAGYGRPAASGPTIAHQHRTPRSPALPRDESDWATAMRYRRRTLVSEHDRDAKGRLAEMLLRAGHATVFRTRGDKEYRYTLAPGAGQAFIGEGWTGELTLRVDSVPDTPHSPEDAAAKRMVRDGLLPYAGSQARAALRIGDVAFEFGTWRADFSTGVLLTLDMGAGGAAKVVQQLLATTVDVPVALELQFVPGSEDTPASDKPQPLQDWDMATLQPGPPVNLRLPLLRAAGDRPTLAVDVATAIFGDPAYDRQLGSPCESSPAVVVDGAGKKLQLVLDRKEYHLDETAHFSGGLRQGDAFGDAGTPMLFFVKVQPKMLADGTKPRPRPLMVPKASGATNDGKVPLPAPQDAHALKLNALREADGSPARLAPGDQLVMHLEYQEKWTASVAVRLTDVPSIAPPPAVYSVLTAASDWSSARVALHASAPLPDRIEYPDLVKDLARGFVRRRALFIWSWPVSPVQALRACLVKVDRSGGAQLPEDAECFCKT